MSVAEFFVTTIYIKRETGKDMYGRSTYQTLTAKAKVEESMEKRVTRDGEQYISFTTIYTDTELRAGDLVSINGTDFFGLFDVGVARNKAGEVVFYKGYAMRGVF